MNEQFVCIKVDREERPDVDAVCMEACQAITGHGGWPLNAFLTPDQAPFYVGTYYPPQSRQGMPSWRAVLEAVSSAWADRREDVLKSSAQVLASIGASTRIRATDEPITEQLLQRGGQRPARLGRSAQRRLRRRAEVPDGVGDRVPADARRARGPAADAARDGPRRDLRPGRRRLLRATPSTRPGPCPTSRRCSTTTRCSRGRTCTGGRCRASRCSARVCRETLDWALREMRSPRRWLLLGARRRLRGRRGQVLRLDGRRAARRARRAVRRRDRVLRSDQRELRARARSLEGRGPEPERLPEIRCKLYGVRAERVRPGTRRQASSRPGTR